MPPEDPRLETLLKPWALKLLIQLLTVLLFRLRYGDLRIVVRDGQVQTIKLEQSFDVRKPQGYDLIGGSLRE